MDFPDEAAARSEGVAMLADFARDIAANLLTNPKWQLDVLGEADEAIFRITVHAECLGSEGYLTGSPSLQVPAPTHPRS